MGKQPLLSESERERLWSAAALCDRYRRMLDELPLGIQSAGAEPGLLREIDRTVEDVLWYIDNAIAQQLVLGLLRLADTDQDAHSLARVLPRLHSGSAGIKPPVLGQVEEAISAYLEAVAPLRVVRDRMIAHLDRRHPGEERLDLEPIDEALRLLLRALRAVDEADGQPRRDLPRQGSARSLGVIIGQGMVARANNPGS